MDARALEPAVKAFSKQLLECFEYHQIDSDPSTQTQIWDLIACKGKQKIWVECKTYKSQVVLPSTTDSLLKTILMRKMKQAISQEDIVLLIILSRIPSFQKDEIFKRYKIIVWDIENLVFYSKSSPILLKQLSQITYFPIDYIEGFPSVEAKLAGLSFAITEGEIVREVEKEVTETNDLIQQLKDCKSGKKHSGDYENICEEIIRTLFETNYFSGNQPFAKLSSIADAFEAGYEIFFRTFTKGICAYVLMCVNFQYCSFPHKRKIYNLTRISSVFNRYSAAARGACEFGFFGFANKNYVIFTGIIEINNLEFRET